MATKKKTTKKKSTSVSKTNLNLIKAEALKKIVEHNRDYLKLDLTLPLGDTCLKKVHTNQWLFTDLPKEFDLANWTVLAKALNANTTRFEGYVENRWYIESVDITCDASSGKYEMKLGLNAFASSYGSYLDNLKNFEQAYKTATTKTKSKAKDTSNAVTNGDNTTIKSGWWGDWVTKMVKEWVGNETDTLKKCKIVHEKFRWQTKWTEYNDMPYTGGSVDNLEKQWSRHSFNCGDGANYLSAFYACCGADTGIYLGPGHYVVRCTVDGKDYWCDHSGGEGMYNTRRGFNETFENIRGGSYYGRYV